MLAVPETSTPIAVEDVDFLAGGHRLQGELAYPERGDLEGAAVLAGPHPFLGGDLHNNVVRGLGDGLAQRRAATLRFNYRGVDRSQGPPVDLVRHLAQFWETSHVPEEMDLWHDVQGAVDFLRAVVGIRVPLALIGYSFGCALLPHIQPGPDAVRVLIAPTPGKHDYTPYLALKEPVLVIASEDDFATDAGQLRDWFQRLPEPKHLILRQLDNHFFRGQEAWLAEVVFEFLASYWR